MYCMTVQSYGTFLLIFSPIDTIQQNPTDVMISHLNCSDDNPRTIKPTSVLSKIISRINYLSLARSRIDLLIGISPHIFTNRYNNTTKPDRYRIRIAMVIKL